MQLEERILFPILSIVFIFSICIFPYHRPDLHIYRLHPALGLRLDLSPHRLYCSLHFSNPCHRGLELLSLSPQFSSSSFRTLSLSSAQSSPLTSRLWLSHLNFRRHRFDSLRCRLNLCHQRLEFVVIF